MPASSPTRVAIVDDHELVNKGLATMLDPFRREVRVVAVSSGDPLRHRVDLALFDIFGHGPDGEEVAQALAASQFVKRFAVYTWNFRTDLVDAALATGAAGYLSKSLGGPSLVEAITRVVRGERVVSPALGEQTGDEQGCEDLTQREAEVLALITQGLSNNEIVEQTHLSINSVKTYIRAAYRKIGVTSRSQAVLWGTRNGLEPDHRRRGSGSRGATAFSQRQSRAPAGASRQSR